MNPTYTTTPLQQLLALIHSDMNSLVLCLVTSVAAAAGALLSWGRYVSLHTNTRRIVHICDVVS